MARRARPIPTQLRGFVRERIRAGMTPSRVRRATEGAFGTESEQLINRVIREEQANLASVNELVSKRPTQIYNFRRFCPPGSNQATVRVGIEVDVVARDGTSKRFATEVEIPAGSAQIRNHIGRAVQLALAQATASGYNAGNLAEYMGDLSSAASAGRSSSFRINYIRC